MAARPRSEAQVRPPRGFVLVSAGIPSTDIVLPDGTRGLLIGSAGALNVTIDGVQLDGLPFQAGTNPGFFEVVRSGGAASNIWAIL